MKIKTDSVLKKEELGESMKDENIHKLEICDENPINRMNLSIYDEISKMNPMLNA